ncbi:MAG: hypothetical protein HC817_08280 [Saprospiraceae bacterium]|nr:hypothetical protein [Saprospiraceae bacterium]
MTNPLSLAQINAYINGETSFLVGLKPSDAVQMPTQQLLYVLGKKLGDEYFHVFDPNFTVESPLQKNRTTDSQWLKRVNMVGINVRTIFSFLNVTKYALTLPAAQQAVHLLPIWEPGVVASLYGVSSKNINPEFFSEEWCSAMPHLDTVEKQLKVTINILHALGKVVGMDVIPHTDRFSEQVIANPHHFEWLQRVDNQIINHENDLHLLVENLIFDFIAKRTISPPNTPSVAHLSKDDFFYKMTELARCQILFGAPDDYEGRLYRRDDIIQMLYEKGFETVPATMGPPYRGLSVDTEGGQIIDKKGRVWIDYTITKPEKFSRVFGPLTRFKLFENKDNNANWVLDFEKARQATWHYAAEYFDQTKATYNFDFMRGDMAHVQMRPDGVPPPQYADEFYDILGYIKKHVQQRIPYFANYAETFLAPPGEMAYGDEVDHLERASADATLGDLQSMVVGSQRFLGEFGRYLDILHTRKVAPNFTVMTADKDDPRFDVFYLKGNEARFFIALFLTEMPSYVSLGFEQRDPHPTPAPNEHYTKLYVFQIDEGEKATQGNYVWGKNTALFERLNAIKKYSDSLLNNLQNYDCQWIIKPNTTLEHKVIAWQCAQYLFCVNLDLDNDVTDLELTNNLKKDTNLHLNFLFSTHGLNENKSSDASLGDSILIKNIVAGEGRVYALRPASSF